MKKKIYITGVFIIIAHVCFGQTGYKPDNKVKSNFKFLYIIHFYDKPPVATKNAFVDPQRTLSWNHLPDSSAKEVCLLLKVDMIYVITLMPDTKLLTLNEVFDLYKIEARHRKLLIKVDDEWIDYPETILISQNQIDKVKKLKGTKGYYIRIILKSYYEIKKELKKEKEKGIKRVG